MLAFKKHGDLDSGDSNDNDELCAACDVCEVMRLLLKKSGNFAVSWYCLLCICLLSLSFGQNLFTFRHQFKAHPVNKQVLSHTGLGVKHVAAKPATKTQPFTLSSSLHHKDSSSASELNTTDSFFHAKPAPKNILAGVVVSKLLFYDTVFHLFCIQ